MAVTYIDGVLYVDNTILSAFETCPAKASISYGLDRRRIDSDNANLEVGRAIHKVLEYYYQGVTLEDCLGQLEIEYKDWANKHIFDNKRLSYENIELVFKSWAQKNPQDKLPFRVEPENIEIAFGVPLNDDGSIVFTGRIDMLAHARYGNSLFAVDHKTTGQVDHRKKKEYSMSSQMTGYLWAMQQLGHDIAGIYINIVHTGIVPTSNRKCATHKTLYEECGFLHMNHELAGPYHRSAQELMEWHTDALSIALEWRMTLDHLNGDITKIQDIRQRGRWIQQTPCAGCEWYDYCKGGQKKFWLVENTIVDPWRPGITAEFT